MLDLFDALAEQATDPEFRGCAAINAMVEAADRGSVVHQVAADHKEQLAAYLATLAGEDLAGALMLLVDGALVTSLRAEKL